ncbi:hypothetical protein GUA46_16140 [Muricauda sp. HICW]|uniref:Uncharacterized protein n=1 Tax=Flagellimonas chongwuensis TaxID=2697365 RepID=A0A850NFH3_9FLAO|nr:hypothetical protein [Allomuricauda chongwuensis]NVN19871.1 hypothetical protein [Allomuricauda chongwuensis]
MNIDDKIELRFYQVLKHQMSIQDFETWVYNSKELEQNLPEDLYLDLISLNYKSKYALNDLTKLIEQYVDYGKFEIKKIQEILESIIQRDEKCAESIEMTYDLYCKGYIFLQKLGLNYGLLVSCPPAGNYQKNWNEISDKEQKELLDKLYPNIIIDAKNALKWFEKRKIIIKNTVDELGNYEYDDFRTEQEKKQGEIEIINLDIENENNAQGFWSKLMNRFK